MIVDGRVHDVSVDHEPPKVTVYVDGRDADTFDLEEEKLSEVAGIAVNYYLGVEPEMMGVEVVQVACVGRQAAIAH
jgi:hypothetical protein